MDEHEAVKRPWGEFLILGNSKSHQVKRITVTPGKRLSYQTHSKRSEHWFVVEGEGRVTIDGVDQQVAPGIAVDLPVGAAHRIANTGDEDLVFVEVQHGVSFEEDDIIRLDDDFGRRDEDVG